MQQDLLGSYPFHLNRAIDLELEEHIFEEDLYFYAHHLHHMLVDEMFSERRLDDAHF